MSGVTLPFKSIGDIDAPLPAGAVTNVLVAGTCSVPAGAVAADLKFTVVGPVAPGHLTVFPTGTPLPLASLVNYVTRQIVANDIAIGHAAGIEVRTTSNNTHTGPVTFRYVPGHGDGGQPLQYGLIAEEVAAVRRIDDLTARLSRLEAKGDAAAR